MIATAEITGVVLAGGRGQRMGGEDKGWVELARRPLIEHVLARLRPQVGALVISANRHLSRYRGFGVPVVEDGTPGFPGPLAGAYAAMRVATTPWLLLAPVDTPWLPLDLCQRLAQVAAQADIVVVHDGERLQPLTALVRTSLEADLARWLESGAGRVLDFYQRHRWCQVDFADRRASFANLNTPQERERAERSLGVEAMSRERGER
ncbi:molybdenum cofactor guanylyltransferase MobA [Salinicola sp. JS01]|uniref:molybdenum cofactor guanylyltransferase MobA n=1 Tax=Salinicola sp. JS01 TaxID=3050071 RepID=UPI00255BEF22|nr:molybdenum cofactor guanylyltransferase MobA [Salinicola sp. JS01]WIX34836.1 molybdenum cofactor guanylyltransferase MobA [Salinicola sp. JS01]